MELRKTNERLCLEGFGGKSEGRTGFAEEPGPSLEALEMSRISK